MSQNLPVNDSKWVQSISQFNKDFKKIHNEDSNKEYLIETGVNLKMFCSFCLKKFKLKK